MLPYYYWTTAKRTRFWSGTLSVVVVLGIGLLVWPYLPGLKLPIQQLAARHPVLQAILPAPLKAPDSTTVSLSGNWLLIPSINVKEQIWDGSSLGVLWTHEGVWHQTGDTSHNLVLAGHRFQYLPPNTDTFYNLNKLKKGDTVTVVWNGKPTAYAVTRTETVTPDHVEILGQTSFPELTLYTCTDLAATKRYVVVAKPIGL